MSIVAMTEVWQQEEAEYRRLAGWVKKGPHEWRVFSQFGEDGVLDWLINHYLIRPVRIYSVEVGASRPVPGGPVECNTGLLLQKGWLGVVIDERPLDMPNYGVQRRVTAENFVDLLDDLHVPDDAGVLSIDVDGIDYWLWESVGVWRPAIVVIEYNPSLDPEKSLTVPYSPEFRYLPGTDYYGASAGALVSLAHRKGYQLVTDVNHVNLFFARKDYLPRSHNEPDLARLAGLLGREYLHLELPYQEVP